MKSEEIMERADNIVEALSLSTSLSFDAAHVQSELLSLVRATLEEAARAVCPWCCEETDAKGNHDGAVRADPQGVRWVHRIRSRPCLAMRIHDLIANLDKEASHE